MHVCVIYTYGFIDHVININRLYKTYEMNILYRWVMDQ